MWWTLAAAALPYVMGALQKKPDQPGAPAPVNLPDRSAYINQMLRSGFNTDSTMYRNASDGVQEQVNRALARQGLRGSSIGMNAMIQGQNQVAQSFIDMQQERQQKAFQQASAYDMARAGVEQGNSQAAANYANQIYNDARARQAGVIKGVGDTANAAMNAYGRQQDRDSWERTMGSQPTSYSGENVMGSGGSTSYGGYNMGPSGGYDFGPSAPWSR